MSDMEAWAIIVGLVAPVISALLKQQGWKKEINTAICFAVALILGLGNVWFAGELEGKTMVIGVALTVAASFTAYKTFFQWTGVDNWLTTATSFKKN